MVRRIGISVACFGTWMVTSVVVGLTPQHPVGTSEPVPVAHQTDVIEIGSRRELFIDHYLIESLSDARLQLHRPRPEEVAVRFDHPWEGAYCGYITVLKDADGYKMYYRGLPSIGRDGTDSETTCCAISDDGIHWEKPKLGLFEYDGSKQNNIVLMGQTPASHNFAPFLDDCPTALPQQRYKALGGTHKSGLIAFASTDGFRWNRIQSEPVFTKGIFDSQNVAFWSTAEQKYVCYFRTWTSGKFKGLRTISRTTSSDFIHWSDPQAMSFGETPKEHLYTNQTTPYFRAPHIYLGLAARFMPGRKVISTEEATKIGLAKQYSNDCSDTVLLTSRGENRYDRTFMESFLRPGVGQENWVSRSNYAARGVVPTGPAEMSIYVSRNYGQPTAYLQRYSLRTDGLASVSAGFAGGEVITKPFSIAIPPTSEQENDGSVRQLTLNLSTSAAGSVLVELQDASGQPIVGHSIEDCDLIVGDRIDRVVSWRGQTDLSEFANQTIRLRIQLRDADLFSFQVR